MMKLQTERLTLRRWTEADVQPFAEINADPEIMRYIGNGRPRSVDATRELVGRVEKHWDEHGFGTFAVELNETGQLIGCAIIAVPNFLPEILPAVEFGWRIRRSLWGKGYAPEAAREAQRFGFEGLDLDRVVSCIHPDNTASIRVAEKLGMTLERETVVPDLEIPCKVYERHR